MRIEFNSSHIRRLYWQNAWRSLRQYGPQTGFPTSAGVFAQTCMNGRDFMHTMNEARTSSLQAAFVRLGADSAEGKRLVMWERSRYF